MPQTRLTWVIGKLEHRLVGDIPGVDFVVFDKARGLAGWQAVRRAVANSRFDALLHMQVSARANLLSLAIPARRRIGYDKARSKELHGLFVNERIRPAPEQHVLDALGSFGEPFGLAGGATRWDIPVSVADRDWAFDQCPDGHPLLAISPCSSHALRNWRAERYAQVADHAIGTLGMQVVLMGGPSAIERKMGDAICAHMRRPVLDLIGKDTLKRALALYQRAALLISPDSGPMHMANAMGTPVLGLHAATNPRRSGPYSSLEWTVNRYDHAARKFLGKPASELRFGTRIQQPGVMDLITTDDVIERLEAFAASNPHSG